MIASPPSPSPSPSPSPNTAIASPSGDRFKVPSVEEVILVGAKTGLPESECRKFHAFYESKGWVVGKTKMKSLNGAISGWKLRWQESNPPNRTGTNGKTYPYTENGKTVYGPELTADDLLNQ